MSKLLQDLGAMRLLLLSAVIITLPMALFSDAEPEGFGVLSAYIAPAVAVLLIFVLLLDALMSRIFVIDNAPTQASPKQASLRIRANLLGVLAILVAWGPFYYGLLSP